ncbi:MAG: hypothetical protein M1817_003865 [Caeruleum heppii]|nr:MAG: hypothetical protein M1817_003865 [Caeruleum heppii]
MGWVEAGEGVGPGDVGSVGGFTVLGRIGPGWMGPRVDRPNGGWTQRWMDTTVDGPNSGRWTYRCVEEAMGRWVEVSTGLGVEEWMGRETDASTGGRIDGSTAVGSMEALDRWVEANQGPVAFEVGPTPAPPWTVGPWIDGRDLPDRLDLDCPRLPFRHPVHLRTLWASHHHTTTTTTTTASAPPPTPLASSPLPSSPTPLSEHYALWLIASPYDRRVTGSWLRSINPPPLGFDEALSFPPSSLTRGFGGDDSGSLPSSKGDSMEAC